MFNLYQNLNKKDEDHKESEVTGHDRFWQERPRTRRKRRAVNRRTQSAIEFDSETIVSARGTLRRGRSASIEDEDSDEEKSYQLTNKIDNLAKILFSRVSAARGCKDSDVRYVLLLSFFFFCFLSIRSFFLLPSLLLLFLFLRPLFLFSSLFHHLVHDHF